MSNDLWLAVTSAVRRSVLGLAVAVPVLACATLALYLINVDVAQVAKLDLWRRLVQLVMLAWLIYLVDITLNGRLSPGAKLLWAMGVLIVWPLAMPVYLLDRVPRFETPPRRCGSPT